MFLEIKEFDNVMSVSTLTMATVNTVYTTHGSPTAVPSLIIIFSLAVIATFIITGFLELYIYVLQIDS